MRSLLNYLLLSLLLSLLAACHSYSPQLSWQQEMQQKIAKYEPKAERRLKPYFIKAGVNYPPQEMALLVFKNTKQMEIWAKNTVDSPWVYIRTFPVLAASGGPGPKLHEGDYQVPEGIYRIVGMNPVSHYDLSLQLNYPNQFDLSKAQADGRTELGGNIFIHGDKLSAGCIALGNKTIEQLFPLIFFVDSLNIIVVIAPNDLRQGPPLLAAKVHPVWLPELYQQLNQELAQFTPAPGAINVPHSQL